MMWHGEWSGANWVMMAVAMLVFWGSAGALVLWLVARARATSDRHTPTPVGPTGPVGPKETSARAREMLNERLARGELSVEEYQTRRDLLTQR